MELKRPVLIVVWLIIIGFAGSMATAKPGNNKFSKNFDAPFCHPTVCKTGLTK